MKIVRNILIAVAFGLLLPSAYAADATVATVNGQPIKQSLLDYIVQDAEAHGQKVDDNARRVILNKLIGSELMRQEAKKQGIDKQADFKVKEDLLQRELLVKTYLEGYLKNHPVSDAETKAEYAKLKQQMGGKEYKARHILVKTEQEAKDIISQLDKGADFAKLAQEKSQDPGSKENGGDLGWFPVGNMVKPFGDAVAKLSKGSYSKTPVQTQFGWHVIQLEDIRAAQPPAYDTVKRMLTKEVQQSKLEKLLIDLRNKAKVEISNAKN